MDTEMSCEANGRGATRRSAFGKLQQQANSPATDTLGSPAHLVNERGYGDPRPGSGRDGTSSLHVRRVRVFGEAAGELCRTHQLASASARHEQRQRQEARIRRRACCQPRARRRWSGLRPSPECGLSRTPRLLPKLRLVRYSRPNVSVRRLHEGAIANKLQHAHSVHFPRRCSCRGSTRPLGRPSRCHF